MAGDAAPGIKEYAPGIGAFAFKTAHQRGFVRDGWHYPAQKTPTPRGCHLVDAGPEQGTPIFFEHFPDDQTRFAAGRQGGIQIIYS